MQIPIEKFEAFNKWQFAQLKNRIKSAITNAGYNLDPIVFNQLTVKSKVTSLSTSREYFLKTQSDTLQYLFTATQLMDDQQNPVLIFEWPNGQKEYEVFDLDKKDSKIIHTDYLVRKAIV